jgi:hypothetical protein
MKRHEQRHEGRSHASSTSRSTLVAHPVGPVVTKPSVVFTRAQRAHWRLCWAQRLARNARAPDASPLTVTLHGRPSSFAQSFAFDLLPTT